MPDEQFNIYHSGGMYRCCIKEISRLEYDIEPDDKAHHRGFSKHASYRF